MKTLLTFAVATLACVAIAQDMTMPPPPELKKLDFLHGSWKSEGKAMDPSGAEIKTSGKATCGKALRGMWVEFKTEENMGPGGDMAGALMLTYDPYKKKYTGAWFDSFSPQHLIVEGDFVGNKLVLTSNEIDMGPDGKMTFRVTYDPKSANHINFLLEMKMGDSWAPAMSIDYKK